MSDLHGKRLWLLKSITKTQTETYRIVFDIRLDLREFDCAGNLIRIGCGSYDESKPGLYCCYILHIHVSLPANLRASSRSKTVFTLPFLW